MSIFHIWDCYRTVVQISNHQVIKVFFIWVSNESWVITSKYSLLRLFLREPLIVLSDRLDKHHSFLVGLHIRQPILILYELGGNSYLPVGHQILSIITVICDMVPKILEDMYSKDIIYTTDINPCFNTTIFPHPVGLRGLCIGVTYIIVSIWRMSSNNSALKKEMYVEHLSRLICFLGRHLALNLLLGRDFFDFSPPKDFFPTTSIDKPASTSKSASITSTIYPNWIWLCPFFFAHRPARYFFILSLLSSDISGHSYIQCPSLFLKWWHCSFPTAFTLLPFLPSLSKSFCTNATSSCTVVVFLLLVASRTSFSCWGGRIYPLFSWGTGRLR